MRSIGRFLLLLLVSALVSCEVKMPGHVMPPEKMEAFLYDYHMVQTMSGEYTSYDYKEKLFYNYVFTKHNVSKEVFDSSMMWYNRYPKHLKRIYENLEARLEADVERLNDARATFQEGVSLDMAYLSADSSDLWTSSKVKMLSSTPLNSRLAFSFKVPDDTTFVKGDSLSFSFMAYFIPRDTLEIVQNAYASVRLDYGDGGVLTRSVRVDTSGVYHLPTLPKPDKKLKSMSGFVYYSDNDTTSLSRLLLSDITVVRIHPLKQNTKKGR